MYLVLYLTSDTMVPNTIKCGIEWKYNIHECQTSKLSIKNMRCECVSTHIVRTRLFDAQLLNEVRRNPSLPLKNVQVLTYLSVQVLEQSASAERYAQCEIFFRWAILITPSGVRFSIPIRITRDYYSI